MLGGTDIDSGGTYASSMATAINTSVVSRQAANIAMHNAYKMRMMMGLFDYEKDNIYRHIPLSVVGQGAQQSLDSAREAMVLLKNDNNALPLPVGKKIAIVGQSAGNYKYYTGNYDGPLCPVGTLMQYCRLIRNRKTTAIAFPASSTKLVALTMPLVALSPPRPNLILPA